MATLIPTLSLTSTTLSDAETFSLSETGSLAVGGQSISFQVVTSATGTVFAAAANYTKSYVLLKNLATDATHIYTIEKADGGDEYMTLGAGEFAFFPWAAAVDLAVDAAAGSSVLEVRIFQAANA